MTELLARPTLDRYGAPLSVPVRSTSQRPPCADVTPAHPRGLLRAVLNVSSKDERDGARRSAGTVIDRMGARLEPVAVFFEMLTCERRRNGQRCGASFPACGWCPFCNPRGVRQ
jgi:hypothetical protein